MAVRGCACPICGGDSVPVISLAFGPKMGLPAAPEIRCCEADDFAFLTDVRQSEYDAYYGTVVNDYRHRETKRDKNSPLSRQVANLHAMLQGYFDTPRHVLDYGCGEADLLRALAVFAPVSRFTGYDPSPSSDAAQARIAASGLANLQITNRREVLGHGAFDLVILSHVAEHLVDFSALAGIGALLRPSGVFYIEVPDALAYSAFERRSFLYYFDRLHVNHFSPRALARLAALFGFRLAATRRYEFPYGDGRPYPAVSVILRKDGSATDTPEVPLYPVLKCYIAAELERAKLLSDEVRDDANLFVWGCGDNFYRSMGPGGPLSRFHNMILLDRQPKEIVIGGSRHRTVEPVAALAGHAGPVIVTVSEASESIVNAIKTIDPGRKIVLI